MSKQVFEEQRLNAYWIAPEDLVIIGLDTKDGPEHLLYDDRVKLPLNPAMVQNIKALGVKKVVNVMKLQVDGADRACVVDGRQRVRCAREANKQLVDEGEEPMKVKVIPERGEEKLIAAIGVSTNCFNAEDSIASKARKAQRLIDRGLTADETANALGVTTTTIASWLKLLDLAAPVVKAVETGQISAHAASKLADMSKQDQAEQLKELLSEGKPVSATKVVKASAKSGRNGAGEKPVAPGKKLAKKVITAGEEGDLSMSQDFIEGIQWALGDLETKKVTVVDGFAKYIDRISK